jgi:hypothetical protein
VTITETILSDPRLVAGLTVALALGLVAQRFLGWRRYAALHRLRVVVFPLLDGRDGLFLVSRKEYRENDAEYLGTVNASVREVFGTLTGEGDGSPHLLSSIKARPLPDGTTQYSAAHVVWTHTDGSQTEAYLFRAPEGGTDVYGHHEPSVMTPRKHLEGAQTDGDPRQVIGPVVGV